MARARRGDREKTSDKGARILIVEARFYDDIADALLVGATKVLKEAGAQFDRLTGTSKPRRDACCTGFLLLGASAQKLAVT